RTWMTYFPVSGNVSCCWLFALKGPGLTTAPVGENTVAVAMAPVGKPLTSSVSMTPSPSCTEKVSWSTLAACSIGRSEARLTNVRATSTFLFIDTTHSEIYTLSLHDALPISRTWMTYFPVSGNVSCCWLFALKAPGLTTAPVGENTVAVAVAPVGKPLAASVSVTRSPACPEKVSWSTLAALRSEERHVGQEHITARSTGLV